MVQRHNAASRRARWAILWSNAYLARFPFSFATVFPEYSVCKACDCGLGTFDARSAHLLLGCLAAAYGGPPPAREFRGTGWRGVYTELLVCWVSLDAAGRLPSLSACSGSSCWLTRFPVWAFIYQGQLARRRNGPEAALPAYSDCASHKAASNRWRPSPTLHLAAKTCPASASACWSTASAHSADW